MTDPSLSPDRLPSPLLRMWTLLLALAVLASGVGVVVLRSSPAVTAGERLSAFDADPSVPAVPTADVEGEQAPAEPVEAPAEAPAPEPEPEPEPAPQPEPEPAPELAAGEVERIPLVPAEPRLSAFAGLSTWIDLYDDEISPERQAEIASAAGVQSIFVQTARFNSPTDIHDPDRLGRLIEAAHDWGLQVMTWYIPDHLDHATDLRRSKAAIEFTTPRGDRADAFGLDIEMESLRDVPERSRRLLQLSAELREWAGPDYPMAAIVLPPLQLDLRPSWWPAFPWAELRPHYDVFIPMSYSSFRGTDPGTTYTWNFRNVVETRLRTGDPNLPIHMAGGIADRLPHVDAFVDALRDGHVLGGGLYDLHTTLPTAWPRLRALRAE